MRLLVACGSGSAGSWEALAKGEHSGNPHRSTAFRPQQRPNAVALWRKPALGHILHFCGLKAALLYPRVCRMDTAKGLTQRLFRAIYFRSVQVSHGRIWFSDSIQSGLS